MTYYRCWNDGDSEDDATLLECDSAEDAAEQFVDRLVCFPDWADRIDGEPFKVRVRDDVDGEMTMWEVQATSSVHCFASPIDDDDASCSHVVTRATGTNTMPIECLHCGTKIELALPVSIDEMAATTRGFVARHRGCEPKVAVKCSNEATFEDAGIDDRGCDVLRCVQCGALVTFDRNVHEFGKSNAKPVGGAS